MPFLKTSMNFRFGVANEDELFSIRDESRFVESTLLLGLGSEFSFVFIEALPAN